MNEPDDVVVVLLLKSGDCIRIADMVTECCAQSVIVVVDSSPSDGLASLSAAGIIYGGASLPYNHPRRIFSRTR
jgi:hypothetical protein